MPSKQINVHEESLNFNKTNWASIADRGTIDCLKPFWLVIFDELCFQAQFALLYGVHEDSYGLLPTYCVLCFIEIWVKTFNIIVFYQCHSRPIKLLNVLVNRSTFTIGLVIKIGTPMAEVTRNHKNCSLWVKVGSKKLAILCCRFECCLPNNNGNYFCCLAKHFVYKRHVHFYAMFIFLFLFGHNRKVGLALQHLNL